MCDDLIINKNDRSSENIHYESTDNVDLEMGYGSFYKIKNKPIKIYKNHNIVQNVHTEQTPYCVPKQSVPYVQQSNNQTNQEYSKDCAVSVPYISTTINKNNNHNIIQNAYTEQTPYCVPKQSVPYVQQSNNQSNQEYVKGCAVSVPYISTAPDESNTAPDESNTAPDESNTASKNTIVPVTDMTDVFINEPITGDTLNLVSKLKQNLEPEQETKLATANELEGHTKLVKNCTNIKTYESVESEYISHESKDRDEDTVEKFQTEQVAGATVLITEEDLSLDNSELYVVQLISRIGNKKRIDENTKKIGQIDPVTTPVPDPVTTSVPDPVTTPVPDPVTTSVPDPVTTSVPDPVTTSVPDSVTTPVPDPVTTPVPEPRVEASLESGPTLETEFLITENDIICHGTLIFENTSIELVDSNQLIPNISAYKKLKL
jgi:hypothetical protein